MKRDILQTVRHIVMGLLFIGMAVIMIFAEKLNLDKQIAFDPIIRDIFGTICFVYGVFRIYRGIKPY